MSADTTEQASATGVLTAEIRDRLGRIIYRGRIHNLITSAGDNVYVGRGAGIGSPAAAPTGMRLGTGTTAVAKTGAGAAVATYLSGSGRAFDATYPQVSGNQATYKVTYPAGTATSASTAISEVVLVNDTIATDAASVAANTVARVLLPNGGSTKQAGDSLTITWTNTITGA